MGITLIILPHFPIFCTRFGKNLSKKPTKKVRFCALAMKNFLHYYLFFFGLQ